MLRNAALRSFIFFVMKASYGYDEFFLVVDLCRSGLSVRQACSEAGLSEAATWKYANSDPRNRKILLDSITSQLQERVISALIERGVEGYLGADGIRRYSDRCLIYLSEKLWITLARSVPQLQEKAGFQSADRVKAVREGGQVIDADFKERVAG